MKKSGAALVVYALEQIGVKYTFGIPGVHNTEIYDELHKSSQIEPILVTHEGGAAFMADGISRSSDSIGTVVAVPAAGTTHGMSGLGEAFLDGIPMLFITGGTRRDTGKSYQLHQLDQEKLTQAVVKKYFLIEKHKDIIPTIYEAYLIATSGEPGPVFIEIPAEIQMFTEEISEMPVFQQPDSSNYGSNQLFEKAVELLQSARKPGLFLGWGAVDAQEAAIEIAERLGAPVATSLQGLSAFPGNHPLHCGVGFGPSSLPSAQKAFEGCDCLLAVGIKFGELATGSFGIKIPEKLIHIDINPDVLNKNYQADIAIEADSRNILPKLAKALENHQSSVDQPKLKSLIRKEKTEYFKGWKSDKKDNIVSPGHFFESLRKQVKDDMIIMTDDGKHTFLTAELFEVRQARHFISPTDFNCMGYCTPASIGVKLANPDKQVVAIVGDGSFMMTCMELVTANSLGLGLVVVVFNDGELGQISQFQKIPLNRKTCTTIGKVNFEGVALATGSAYIEIKNDLETDEKLATALKQSEEGKTVIVDVNIDYSKRTMLTKGVVKTNLSRFPFKQKVRFLSRALKRHLMG